MTYLRSCQLPSAGSRKVYFLSDFASHPSSANFKRTRRKAVRWTPERERSARRGKNGRFGGLGDAVDALTNTTWKKAALATAGIIGVPTATYLGVRSKYRAGVPQSAAMAKVGAAAVTVPDLPDSKKQITFAIGGFDGNNKASFTLKDGFESELADHHIAPIVQADFNVKTQYKPGDNPVAYTAKQVKEISKAFYNTVGREGRNPVSVQLATQAYAYHLKYPNKPINFIGHSAGGIVAHEATDILEQLGVKTRTVALGSPYMGFAKPRNSKESITFFNDGDPVAKFPAMNAVTVPTTSKSLDAHFLPRYSESPEVRRRVREFLAA